MNIFLRAHQETLKCLIECQVEFLLIGGYAVIYYGYIRTTSDMDLWLRPTNENKEKLIEALQIAGFEGVQDLRPLNFTKHLTFSAGEEPGKIDFINYINQVSFEEAEKNKIIFHFGGLSIPVLNIDDLILTKMSTGRKKDEADVEELQRILKFKRQ